MNGPKLCLYQSAFSNIRDGMSLWPELLCSKFTEHRVEELFSLYCTQAGATCDNGHSLSYALSV